MYSCTFSGWIGGFCVLCWYECLVILARDLFIRRCDHINYLSLRLADSGSVYAFAEETYNLAFHFITYVIVTSQKYLGIKFVRSLDYVSLFLMYTKIYV